MTPLATLERRNTTPNNGTDEDQAPGVGSKRSDMLRLRLYECQRWADPLMKGFGRAAIFLHSQHLYDARFLPYGSQLIPLAVILTALEHDWCKRRRDTDC